jgi:hypothetical protein
MQETRLTTSFFCFFFQDEYSLGEFSEDFKELDAHLLSFT